MIRHDAAMRPHRSTPDRRSSSLVILMVSARFAPYVGGTEIHTGLVASELARRGHDVTVLTTDLTGKLAATEQVDGFEVVRVRAWPPRSDLYIAPGLGDIIDRGGWDLVHVQGYHTAVAPLALRAAQRRGIPTAVTFHSGGHSSPLRNAMRPLHARAVRQWLRAADLLVAVSRFEADLFSTRLGIDRRRIEVIPNGVSDFAPESSPGPSLRIVSEGPTILSLGRLERYKGHHRVIRAMPHLLEVDPTIRLVILGEGPYRKRLERLVSRLGVGAHVSFEYVPSHQRQRLHDIMREASLAVLLSDYESHGMAAHEALQAGLPLIVLDRTALSDLVSAGLARAVPPRATDREVTGIILRTLSAANDDKAASTRAATAATLERMQQSWPEIVDRLEQAYHRVLGRPGDGPSSADRGRRQLP